MGVEAHLSLQEVNVGSGGEWVFPEGGWRFACLQSGQAYLLAQPPHALEVTDALMLSPSCRGVIRASQLTPVQLSYFRFQPERMTDLLTPVERHFLESQETQSRLSFRVFRSQEPVAVQFAKLLRMAGAQNTLAKRSWILQLIASAVGADEALGAPEQHAVSNARERVLARLAQMTENEFISCSVEALAAQCRCSTRHLSRLFHGAFGISLSARQTELRMQKAARLLRESESLISQIALECGYRHIGLFNSTFKKRWKQTPSQWRRDNAADSELVRAAVR